MGRRSRLQMLGVVSALQACTSWAQAPPCPQVRLTWRAPAGCPARDEVLSSIDRLRPPSSHPTAATVASANVTRREDGRWSLALRTHARNVAGVRTLVANSCAQVTDAAALILALTLDDAPSEPSAPTSAPPPTRPTGSPLGVAARLSFALDGGTLPSAAPGLNATLAILRGRLRLELGVTYLFPRRGVNASNVGGDIALLSAGVRGCVALLRGPIEPRLCAGVEGGAMSGTGVGLPTPASGASPWWGLFAGAAVALSLSSHLSLHFAVDAGLSVASPDFVVDDVVLVHRPSTALARGASGVEWRF